MKKAHTKKTNKKAWIGEHCSESDETLRELNSKDGVPPGERLDHCETGESCYCPRSFNKMLHRRMRDTEPMDRTLH